MKIRRLPARVLSPFFQYFVKYYFKKPRNYNYKNIKAKVFPGVFFPHFTISTKILLNFLDTENLSGKSLLELGCGTGIISCFAAKKGANVTASDVNMAALENAEFNANNNQVQVKTVLSNLFDNLKEQSFDYIIINPPYYPKNPNSDAEKAWYCGENFEYFKKLFSQLKAEPYKASKIVMILSEDCELESIQKIATEHNLVFHLFHQEIKTGEENYLFRIEALASL
ncbi:MAG: methyltransferase [Crocinitomicaceae bacterium]